MTADTKGKKETVARSPGPSYQDLLDREKNPVPEVPDPMVHSYHDINEPFILGETIIQPFEVFHPDPCLAYRIERQGKVFIFCTDHEYRRGEDPDHPLQLASLEKGTGDMDAAVDYVRRYLVEKPEDADAQVNLGDLLRDSGELDAAEEHYMQASMLESQPVEAQWNLRDPIAGATLR